MIIREIIDFMTPVRITRLSKSMIYSDTKEPVFAGDVFFLAGKLNYVVDNKRKLILKIGLLNYVIENTATWIDLKLC
jgi:hypothetical protein